MNACPRAALSAFAATLIAGPLVAQEQAANPAVLEEIIVTARKERERLLDVPLAITALTGQAIEDRGIRNLYDVAANTPGLTFSNVEGEFLPVPVIRGMAPIDIFGENNAAIFVDGVYVSGREGLNFSQLDLERIEVIRGPQAALYGRNSFAGAINYVTSKPTDEPHGKAELTVGSEGRLLGSLSLSGPILPGKLKGRIALLYDNFDGSYENRFPGGGPDIGGYRFKTAQGTLLFTPDDVFEGEFSLYVSRDEIDNSAIQPIAANCEDRRSVQPPPVPLPSSRLQNFCGEFPVVGSNGISVIPAATGEDRDLTRGHLRLQWKTEAGVLSALSGYSKVGQSYVLDGSRAIGETVPFTYLAAPLGRFMGFPSGVRRQFQTGLVQFGPGDETEEFSQEIRFTSAVGHRFRYSVGAYYHRTTTRDFEDGLIATRPLPADFGTFCLACTPVGPGVYADFAAGAGDAAFLEWFTDPRGGINPATRYRSTIEAPALFGYTEFDFTGRWTGRVEARYTDEKRGFNNYDGDTAITRRGSDTWGLVNWRATLDFKPADNWTLYGSIAHAEKGGGFDSATVQFVSDPRVDVFVPGAFDPEQNRSYELGVKAELFDRRLGIEADVFYNDWSDIVIPQVLSTVDGRELVMPTAFYVNAGDATVRGAELAVNAHPTRRIDLHAGLAWIDAEYGRAQLESFRQFPSYAPLGDISGNQILRMSRWQANAGAGYVAPLPRGTSDWFVRTDVAYRGRQFADATNEAIIPEQLLVNASLGLRGARWTLELWGRNLTNEDKPVAAYRDVFFSNTLPSGVSNGGTFFPWRYSVSYPRLRTYGLTLRMRF